VLVDTESKVRNLIQGLAGEFQLDAFGFEQGGVLLDQRRLRFGKDADKIFHGQRLQLHADGEAALQFRNQVAGFGDVERAGGDEQNVVGAHHAVASVDGGAFHNGKNIALHALTRNVGPVAAFAAGNLINLIEKYDARLLHALDGDARNLVHINQALLLFLDQVFHRLANLHFALLGALAEDVGQHIFDVDIDLFHALVGDDFKGGEGLFPHFELNRALIEFALAQLLPQLLARALVGIAF